MTVGEKILIVGENEDSDLDVLDGLMEDAHTEVGKR